MKLPRHFFENYFIECQDYILSYSHTTHQYKKGDYLFQNMNLLPEENIYYYILSGYTLAHGTTESGERKIICYYAKGIFPNIDLNDDIFSNYSSELVEALTNVTVLVYKKETMIEMLKNSFEFTRTVINFASEIIAILSYQTMILPYISAEVRLCDFLYLSYIFPPEVQRHRPEYIFGSQEQIAQFIGVTRPQVTRMIRVLKEKGIVESHRGFVRILNLKELQGRCSDSLTIL